MEVRFQKSFPLPSRGAWPLEDHRSAFVLSLSQSVRARGAPTANIVFQWSYVHFFLNCVRTTLQVGRNHAARWPLAQSSPSRNSMELRRRGRGALFSVAMADPRIRRHNVSNP